jgi:hypothetical protein
MDRWRGRTGGLTIAAGIVVLLGAGAVLAGSQGRELVVRGFDGSELARVELPSHGRFTLRYRNSVYGSLVEERFVVTTEGRLRLVGLAADELAVLEEYYAVDRPAVRQPAGSSTAWEAEPSLTVEQEAILIAATDLGERTLLVDGASPLELWRLVDDAAPSVWLGLER